MKKLISILLTVTMLLSLFVVAIPASAEEKKATVAADHVPGDFDGDGQTDMGAVAIDTIEELQAMQGKKGYLTRDFVVTMSDAKPATDTNNAFTIAGGWPSANTYLDGCGYTIEFDKTVAKGGAATPVALFNGTAGTVHVKNLNLTGVINAESDSHVAPLCKHGGSGNVENVVVDVDITVKSIGANGAISGVWGKAEVAGGKPQTVSMKDVHFTGSIDVKCAVSTGAYGGVGGLIGNNKGITELENCSNSGIITVTENGETNGNVGGLIGYAAGTVNISDSSNSGNVTVKGKTPCVGGLIGKAEAKVTIADSANSGNVSMTTIEEAYGHNAIGGFVGAVMGANDPAKAGSITGCTNSGAVSLAHNDSSKNIGNAHVGGIVGRMFQTAGFSFEACTNSGAINYNTTFGAGWGSTGGIVGTFITITNTGTDAITLQVKNCVNNAAITAPAGVGGIVGTAKQFNHENKGKGTINLEILGCKNTATITGKEIGGNSSLATAGIVGDICADSQDSTLKLTVSDCINTGAVTGKGWHAGGVVGRYSWATAEATATVERCVNTGAVTLDRSATKEDPWLDSAGIVCQATDGSKIAINDCINTGAISTAEATGMSTYPITNCVNTVVSGSTITTDLSYITVSGNVYLASSVKRSDATYHKFSNEASPFEMASMISEFVNYTTNDKELLLNAVLTPSTAYVNAYKVYAEAFAFKNFANANDYSTTSWADFDAALTTASVVLFGSDAPADADVIAAAAAVTGAKDGLVKLDRDALNAAIVAAGELVEEEYSTETWNAIQNALNAANAALNAMSQADIDSATSALNSAISGAIKLDSSALKDLIASAELFSEEFFTPDSWAVLMDALEEANAALASRSQTKMDDAAVALEAAMEGLTDIDDVEEPSDDEEDEGDDNDEDKPDDGQTTGTDGSSGTTDKNKNEDKKGCGSAIAASTVVLATVAVLGLGLKKKED